MDDPFITREFVPGDLPYIMSTWLRELHDNYSGPLPDKMWFDVHREYIEKLFASDRVIVKILAAADNVSEIIGYVVAIPEEVLLWVHIRKSLRNHQLAKRLVILARCLNSPMAFTSRLGCKKLVNKYQGRSLRSITLMR